MCTDLWKLVQLLRTERSPPLSAAVNTNSWQSQTPHSLSHHNLGGKHREEDREGQTKKERFSLHVFRSCMRWWPKIPHRVVFAFSPFSFNFDCLIYTKKKCISSNVLPRALNICMPPYFPSKSTVLLRGLKALHIRTKTTSKQPGITMETDCVDFELVYRIKDRKKARDCFFPEPHCLTCDQSNRISDPSSSVQSAHLTWAGGSGHSGTVPWTLRCAWRTPPRTGLHGWSGWHTAATARPGAATKHTQFRPICSVLT